MLMLYYTDVSYFVIVVITGFVGVTIILLLPLILVFVTDLVKAILSSDLSS